MLRIAFPFISNKVWHGGHNYLLNLFSVISDYRLKEFQPVIFVGTDISNEELKPFFKIKSIEIIKTHLFNRSRRRISLIKSLFFLVDNEIENLFLKKKINIIFENANFFGINLRIPAIAWMPDFQHRVIPKFFLIKDWIKRELGFRLQIVTGRFIMVSSKDSYNDCKKYYPNAANSTYIVRFAINPKKVNFHTNLNLIKKKYSLPQKYFYLPNQFWEHKNHLTVIKALSLLKKLGHKVIVVSSGKQMSSNNSNYFEHILKLIKSSKIDNMFILLGIIPYKDVLSLMKGSISVLNPSLFEGRSTTVEECIALKVPLILSDINSHKEQVGDKAIFFNQTDHNSLATVLLKVWQKKIFIRNKKISLKSNLDRIQVFLNDFKCLVKNIINHKKN